MRRKKDVIHYDVAEGADLPQENTPFILGPKTEFLGAESGWSVGRRAIVEFYSDEKMECLLAKVLVRGRLVKDFCVTVWDGHKEGA